MRELTGNEKSVYDWIREADTEDIALIQVEFDGLETAAICNVSVDTEPAELPGLFNVTQNITPLAVLVTPEMFHKLANPVTGLPE